MKQLALDDGGEQQSTTPTTSRRSTTCRTCLWLNALMGCVGAIALPIGFLGFLVPAQDTRGMIETMLHDRWPLKPVLDPPRAIVGLNC